MNALRGLKGKLAGAGGRLGKGVERLREVVGGMKLEDESGRSTDDESADGWPLAGGGEESVVAAASRCFRDEWSAYVQVATARLGEDARLRQLAVVLDIYHALCVAWRGDVDGDSLGFSPGLMVLGGILGKDNSFCAELATIACAEMEKLEWQLESHAADTFEDAVSEHTAHDAVRTTGTPSLLQFLNVLASIQWNGKDVAAFERAGLLEVLISALSDRLHVDSGTASLTIPSALSGQGGMAGEDDWEPSELDEAMWILTGKLLLQSTIVRNLVNVERGKETMALLFDMASLAGRTGQQRWSRGQALSSLKLLLDYGSSATSMSAYLQAYGCLGKVLQRLAKSDVVTWDMGDRVGALGVVVGFVCILAPFSPKFVSDFDHCEGCTLLRKAIVWMQKEMHKEMHKEACDVAPMLPGVQALMKLVECAVGYLGQLVILNDDPSPRSTSAHPTPASSAARPPCATASPSIKSGERDADKGGGGAGGDSQRKLGSVLALETLVVVFEESVVSETRQAVLQELARVYASRGVNYRILCGDALLPLPPPIGATCVVDAVCCSVVLCACSVPLCSVLKCIVNVASALC